MSRGSDFRTVSKEGLDRIMSSRGERLPEDAVFVYKTLHDEFSGKVYVSGDEKAFMAVNSEGDYVIFTGDWSSLDIPEELLPGEFFTPACAPDALEKLKELRSMKEGWPCWRYVRLEGYGSGEWDSLERLRPEDAAFVNRHWNLREDAEEYLRSRFELFESACIREDGELIAWAGLHFSFPGVGEMGFAHTMEEHRGKGLATLITKALVNRIVAEGNDALCFMFKTNDASIHVIEKCGFERKGEATWANFGPRE